ncbi:cardiolipin synthase B [Nodosilinea sp. P-1105]|uniref:phospholipase D-like domain-containing protein n=1 Tax=Nodosilinea sp. P-1105 TaxID=2546229 RepID=UPI00146BC99F|nr:cardiolipin synthase B [Nodosilinea sp. P-1105]NMF82016.1 cardiolipin synthase B [Nodosilinea sp. P-1105]
MPSPLDSQDADQKPPSVHWWWWLAGGVGVLLIALFGYVYAKGIFRTAPDYSIANVPGLEDPQFHLSLVGLTNAVATTGYMTGFWDNVDDIYAARKAAMAQAERLIQYETYFMTPGRRADDFADVVVERALAGVTVQLLFDHQGTEAMPAEYWQRLRNMGVQVEFFRQPDWRAPLEYNSRSHRKLLIIDGQQVLIGGAGISDYWDGVEFDHDTAPWLDFEVAYEGEIVRLLQGKFLQNWAYAGGDINLDREVSTGPDEAVVPLYITDDTSTLNESSIRMLVQLSALAAQQRLWVGSPYFVPDRNTAQALIDAQGSGVDVRVLTMGDATDKRFVHLASRELYGDLLQAGIEVCEYQPSMMHAKFILVDADWVSTGSANFDPRSYFHNDELNISGPYPQLSDAVEQFFLNAMDNSRCLSYPEWQNRPWTEKLTGQVALIFKNLL